MFTNGSTSPICVPTGLSANVVGIDGMFTLIVSQKKRYSFLCEIFRVIDVG